MQKIILFFLISLGIAVTIAPLVIMLLRKLKAGQSILKYVDFHAKKSGTPTMGGIIFILPLVILAPFFIKISTPFALVTLFAAVGYAVLGFLDDFIKIKTKNNLGLRAYQKIIGQGGIALLVSIYYLMVNPDGRVVIPFFNIMVDLGWGIFPLVFLILVATTNSVNLTDGIDGLAGTVSLVYLVFLGILIWFVDGIIDIPEIQEFSIIIAISVASLMGFLLFNTNRASVFMGDTGSLFLGGLIATLSIFSFMGFFIIFLGIMFVLSALSVIVQVAYFKKTGGKRVFLMTPFHHHLEMKGLGEARIVAIYASITAVMGVLLAIFFT